VRVGFGLDIGGYGKKGATILTAAVAQHREIKVSVLTNSAFSRTLSGDSDLLEQITQEHDLLLQLIDIGPIAVDVPIDIQGLPSPPNVTRVWELTLRPIDKAFGGLAPVADKLGYCVARFTKLLATSNRFKAGTNIYETYPAASLSVCGCVAKGYKKGEESPKVRSAIIEKFKISDHSLSHDELDSVICALAAVGENDEILERDALKQEMLRRLKNEASHNRHSVPKGYRLLSRCPSYPQIKIDRVPVSEWLQKYLQ
jgi:predicted nuclease with RNAse H fold